MRLREFTNAEEQLGLLRTIIDNTWRAVADEAAEQKRQQELERIAASKKPRSKNTRRASAPRTYKPVPTPQPIPKATATTADKASADKAPAPATTATQSTPAQTQPSAQPTTPSAAKQTAAKSPSAPQQPIRPYSSVAMRKQWGVQ